MNAQLLSSLRIVAARVITTTVISVQIVRAPHTYNTYATDYFAELYTKEK